MAIINGRISTISADSNLPDSVIRQLRISLSFTLLSFGIAVWAGTSLSSRGITAPSQATLLTYAILLYGVIAGYLLNLKLVMGALNCDLTWFSTNLFHIPNWIAHLSTIKPIDFLQAWLSKQVHQIKHSDSHPIEELHLLRKAIHDLKSPLFAIHGYAELLTNPSLKNNEEFIQDCQHTIITQIDQISSLLDDLGTAANLSLDQVEFNRQPFAVDELVRQLIDEFERETRRSISYTTDCEQVHFYGDPIRLSEAIWNLIDNAIKYSPSDKPVEITLNRMKRSDTVSLSIRDYGSGITSTDQSKLFQPFGKIRSKSNVHIPGSGFGLFIAQKIVKRHHGAISVQSEYGEGSTFTIHLPINERKKVIS